MAVCPNKLGSFQLFFFIFQKAGIQNWNVEIASRQLSDPLGALRQLMQLFRGRGAAHGTNCNKYLTQDPNSEFVFNRIKIFTFSLQLWKFVLAQ